MTRSSWSNTALCFARYLSFSCFFFLPKMEQLICSFFDFSIAWQAILHSYVADVLITLMQQIFLWWESFLSNYWALSQHPPSYLELRTGNEASSPGSSHLPGLPPVVVILADDLQDVPGVEGDAGLGAGDQVIVHRVILKLGPDKDVTRGRGWAIRGNNLGIFKWRRSVLVNISELSVWYYWAHLEGDASPGLPQQLLQALNWLIGHTYPINFSYFIPNMKSGLKVLLSILCSYTKGQLVSIAEQKA